MRVLARRHCSPRTTTSSPISPMPRGRGELSRRGPRVEGRHRVPPQNRGWTIRSQLRHPRRPPRRTAGHRDRARARNPAGARARRACPRWTAVGQRHTYGSTAAARIVSAARAARRQAARAARRRRYRPVDAARGSHAACRGKERAVTSRNGRHGPPKGGHYVLLLLLATIACGRQPRDPNVIIVAIQSGPNNLDPRVGTDSVSQNIDQVLFNGLMKVDEHLNVAPDLAERLDNPEPTVYVATLRRGVRFHDGHELTSADVVYTFHSLLAPAFVSAKKGGYSHLASVDAVDRYTIRFTLKQPFASFLVNLAALPIVGDGAPVSLRDHPIGTGPYRFVRYVPDDRLELERFPDYYAGAPKNAGLLFRIVPDDVMRGLELRKGTLDVVVN